MVKCAFFYRTIVLAEVQQVFVAFKHHVPILTYSTRAASKTHQLRRDTRTTARDCAVLRKRSNVLKVWSDLPSETFNVP